MVIKKRIKLAFRIECQKTVETAKLSYLTNLGNKGNKPGTSQKVLLEDYQAE